MTEAAGENAYSELTEQRLADALAAAAEQAEDSDLLLAAADRVKRFNRFATLIGLLAPGGTAPRTGLEQLYQQSADPDVTESPIVFDLRSMLEQHWGEWTPALREAEGIPQELPEFS